MPREPPAGGVFASATPRKRLERRGTDRSRRPPAPGLRMAHLHSSARTATAADSELSRLFGEREARPRTSIDAWCLRIDRRAHASRRLPRAATMVRARSSRHRPFRHIATTRSRGASTIRRRVAWRPETCHRCVSGSFVPLVSWPPPRCAPLDPRRAASAPASTDLLVSFPSSRVSLSSRRTTPSSPRRSRRSTKSAQTCRSSSQTTSSSNGTSVWAKAGSAPPTEPSGEVRSPLARRPQIAFSSPKRARHAKKRTPNPIRESRTFSPL